MTLLSLASFHPGDISLNASGSAEIAPVWSPDGRSVAYFSDRSGEYKLYVAPQEGMAKPREIALPQPSRPYSPAWSPDGRRIAYQDSHLNLWVLDVASGRATLADTDPHFSGSRSIEPVWSPDSRWSRIPSGCRRSCAPSSSTTWRAAPSGR